MNTGSPRSLGATIKRRRQELGWSQEEFAARVASRGDRAFRQCDVSRLERGKVRLPHRERLSQIAAVLELPVGELLARSGWVGAETLFPAEASAATAPEPLTRSFEETTAWREVMAQARATLAESQAILARCEAIAARYQPILSPHGSSQHRVPAKASATTTDSA